MVGSAFMSWKILFDHITTMLMTMMIINVTILMNCPEVGYCAKALGYIDFRLGWVRLGLVRLGLAA